MRNLSIDDGASTMGGSKTEGMLTMMETTTESSWISDLPFSLQVEAKDLGDEDLGGYDDDDLDEFDDDEEDEDDDEDEPFVEPTLPKIFVSAAFITSGFTAASIPTTTICSE